MPTAPTSQQIAAALAADDDHRSRIRAATWLLARQHRWFSPEFINRVQIGRAHV